MTKTKNAKKLDVKVGMTGLTYVRSMPQDEANKLFVKSLPKPLPGANNYLKDFLVVMNHTMSSMPSFALSDILYSSRVFALPITEVTKLFNVWVEQMITLNKLTREHGAYEDYIYIVQ